MRHRHRWLIGATIAVALAAALLLFAPARLASHAAGDVIYVDADAGGSNDGSSWANAYTNMQDALAEAASGDQIWVAKGTYKPAAPGGARTTSFKLKNGVTLYGGVDPPAAADLAHRDWEANATILSGDLNGDDGPDFANNGENSYHVFYHPAGTALDNTAVLDGFIITAGNASTGSWPHMCGGGMFNEDSSPNVIHCTFAGNSAYNYGGGIYNYQTTAPLVSECTFRGNKAGLGGGIYNMKASPYVALSKFEDNSAGYAGAVYNDQGTPDYTDCTFASNSAEVYGDGGAMFNQSTTPALTRCTFTGNTADRDGGAMFNFNASPVLKDVTFQGNSADTSGGAMYNRDSSAPKLFNATFWGNSAGYYGGGMYNMNSSAPVLTNCTFWGNSADLYGGGALLNSSSSTAALTNCILWHDRPDEISNYDGSSSAAVTYSDIEGGHAGTGNMAADPRLVDPPNADLHLGACSPCIDRGDNSAPELPDYDFEGDGRILDGNEDGTATVDMGADEFAGVASCSRFYLPVVLR
jgi:predicted outer membrane repeat protein